MEILQSPVRFMDNPFNYTRFEENYVSNPNATILFDYAAQIPQELLEDNPQAVGSKIATYELGYGKGKVLVMGIYAQRLNGNEKFLQFFDHIRTAASHWVNLTNMTVRPEMNQRLIGG